MARIHQAHTPTQNFIRLLWVAVIAMSVGFVWTVGQTGLKQTNANLCELWRSLPLPPYQTCEFQEALVYIWLAAALVGAIYIFFEVYRWVYTLENRSAQLVALLALVIFFVTGSGVSIFLLVKALNKSPALAEIAHTNEQNPATNSAGSYVLIWDNHLGHTYSSEGTTIVTEAIQIGAKNGPNREMRLENAYIVSGQGAGEVPMKVGSDEGWIAPKDTNTIPPDHSIIFRAEFTPTPARDFFAKWKTFRITVKHDGGATLTKDVDENMVAALYSSFRPNPIGPQVTARPAVTVPDPPIPTTPPKKAGREYVDAHVTPEFLVGVYDGNTRLRAETLVSEQVGKWMHVSGPLGEVHPSGRTDALVVFETRRKPTVYMWFSGEWLDQLALLPKNQNVNVIGQLKKVTGYNATVELENCELLDY
jgi:hypothetical protein